MQPGWRGDPPQAWPIAILLCRCHPSPSVDCFRKCSPAYEFKYTCLAAILQGDPRPCCPYLFFHPEKTSSVIHKSIALRVSVDKREAWGRHSSISSRLFFSQGSPVWSAPRRSSRTSTTSPCYQAPGGSSRTTASRAGQTQSGFRVRLRPQHRLPVRSMRTTGRRMPILPSISPVRRAAQARSAIGWRRRTARSEMAMSSRSIPASRRSGPGRPIIPTASKSA